MDSHESLNRILAEAGVTKIVYALVMPETEQTIDAVYDGQVLGGGRDAYHHLFREAWTQKQDRVHEAFFLRWMEWTQSVVRIPKEEFPFCYPIAGASEGLREAIHAYGSRARQRAFCRPFIVSKGSMKVLAHTPERLPFPSSTIEGAVGVRRSKPLANAISFTSVNHRQLMVACGTNGKPLSPR